MILTCPSCATRYFVDDTAVRPSGRKVRCVACGHVWKAKPEAPKLDLESLGLTGADPLAMTDTPVKRFDPEAAKEALRRRWRRALALGVGAPGVAVGAMLVSAWFFRSEVVAAWPQAASAYAMVGIRATATGLVFENVEAGPSAAGLLQVSARVRNVTERPRPAPLVRVRVRNTDGDVAMQTFAALPASQLGPDETVLFTVDLPGAPADMERVELTFEPIGDGDVTPDGGEE